jgi:hypothetical protein
MRLNKNESYHDEMPWGIDALDVGDTPGLGGLTLVLGDRAWPVRNPGYKGHVKFARRALAAGPVRAAVQLTASNVVPEIADVSVRTTFIIYAGHRESEVRAAVAGCPTPALLAPGLTRLPREETFVDKSLGCLGSWGRQDDRIGQIGMGLIVPPERLADVVELADQRQLRCRAADGVFRYWIIGEWRRGRRFPIAPSAGNWSKQLGELAAQLHRPARVSIGPVETLR